MPENAPTIEEARVQALHALHNMLPLPSPIKHVAAAYRPALFERVWWHMANGVPVDRFRRWLKFWLWTLVDAIPPYHLAEGVLEDKETNPRRGSYIRVASVRIEVDRATCDTLAMGEQLRVRYTRGKRAINIDRLVSGTGPE